MKFKDYKKKKMKDPEFAKAYEELRPEADAILASLAPAPQDPPQEEKTTPTPPKK